MRRIFIFLFLAIAAIAHTTEKAMVIVIPSYNNRTWCERNLESALSQKYSHFRVIYIDDASTDGTGDFVERYIQGSDRVTVVRNQERLGSLANIYRAVWSCHPEEIVLLLDGDDWFAHDCVLQKVAEAYANPDVWVTYGQFVYSNQSPGWARQVPESVIANNRFRYYDWVTTHLKTFYAGLFQQIHLEDLIDHNRFFSMAGDLAFMLPIMEMAGFHSRFISDVLYVYNIENQINDHKVNCNLQLYYTSVIRSMRPYLPVDSFSSVPFPNIPASLIWTKAPDIPMNLREAFTLNGQIPVLEWFLDDSYVEAKFYAREKIDACIERVKRRETSYYADTDTWLYQALEAYPIKGKKVALIGSVEPWYESVVLAFGGDPVTIEYNPIVTDDSRLQVMTVEEYEKNPIQFDVVLSISSTEHDGLGRYGDPINPYADLEFMAKLRNQWLKKEGILILAVPMGPDCLVWNAHRIYGPRRFPLLVNGWTIQGAFGFQSQCFSLPLGYQGYQPVFVLKPL